MKNCCFRGKKKEEKRGNPQPDVTTRSDLFWKRWEWTHNAKCSQPLGVIPESTFNTLAALRLKKLSVIVVRS